MPAFHPEMLNVGVERFGDPQPVQSEQAGEGVVAAPGEAGLDQEHPEFVAVEAGGVRLVVQPRAAHMHRR